MSRHVFTVNLRDEPGVVETYDAHHRAVWPEVRDSLLGHGVQNMDIYRLERQLVMVVDVRDGLDYRSLFEAHARSHPRVAEWEALMRSLQTPPPAARPGEWWAAMNPVCHLGPNAAASPSTEDQEPGRAHVADSPRAS